MGVVVVLLALVIAIVLPAAAQGQSQEPYPLLRAYAHNDQENGPPLTAALANGLCNVETDTNFLDGQLVVGHNCLFPWRQCNQTLADTYLTPLAKLYGTNGGFILSRANKLSVCTEFTFVIDMKTEASSSYAALSALLDQYSTQYPGLLTVFSNASMISQGAVTVVLSGNRISPDQLAREPLRYLTLDGRIPENENDSWPADVIGWLSQNWDAVFNSRATPFSAETCARIGEIAAKAHTKGQRVRFWCVGENMNDRRLRLLAFRNIPESEEFWSELVRCGCDLLNLDDYVRGAAWLLV